MWITRAERLLLVLSVTAALSGAAQAEDQKQICRNVYDDTMTYAVGCFTPRPEHYTCPANGSPCEQDSLLSFDATQPYASRACDNRVVKQVCGPAEMFTQEPTK